MDQLVLAPGESRAWWLKRALDLIVAALGLVVLAPVLLLVAVAIRAESSGSPLFGQDRVGRGGRRFRLYKLRTMVDGAEARMAELADRNMHLHHGDPRMFKLADDPRVTRIGRVLRRWSIDELPQLYNVLRGDMSLVGPRPLMPEEDRHVLGAARRRSGVRPGLTGPWQVAGRNDVPFGEMLHLDCAYVEDWSLGADIRLLARTLPAVVRRQSAA